MGMQGLHQTLFREGGVWIRTCVHIYIYICTHNRCLMYTVGNFAAHKYEVPPRELSWTRRVVF